MNRKVRFHGKYQGHVTMNMVIPYLLRNAKKVN